jgi:hypothetical protein
VSSVAVNTDWIFPADVVDHAPVARMSKHPLVRLDGTVIVAIAFVPDMATIGVVGAIVVAEAMVAAEPFSIKESWSCPSTRVPLLLVPLVLRFTFPEADRQKYVSLADCPLVAELHCQHALLGVCIPGSVLNPPIAAPKMSSGQTPEVKSDKYVRG